MFGLFGVFHHQYFVTFCLLLRLPHSNLIMLSAKVVLHNHENNRAMIDRIIDRGPQTRYFRLSYRLEISPKLQLKVLSLR